MMGRLRRGFLIQLSLLLGLCGCAGEPKQDAAADIVLLEPVGAVSDYETAAYRSLYDAATFPAGVYPETREYAFDTAQSFSYYGALPGTFVEKGDILLGADLTNVEERIKSMRESIADMEEEHEEYIKEQQAAIQEATEEIKACKEELDKHFTVEPSYQYLLGNYEMAVLNEEVLKQKLEQQEQIYELDYGYRQEQLSQLLEEREKGFLYAAESGTVVSAGLFNAGDTIQENQYAAAVADLDRKIIKSEYISAAKLSKAKEIYATIDGIRYEITYQPMSAGAYAQMTENGGTASSTFFFAEEAGEVQVSDYATVTLVYNSREDVLTVSRSALHKDETGTFVYVYKDGENVYTPVKTGLSDGIYTEIVSGLAAGDKVLVQRVEEYGNKTAIVERGDYAEIFGANGYVYYPASVYAVCEVDYGTVTFTEKKVSLYQHVEKGDVIATVHVEADEVEMERLQLQITRLEERLADYESLWEKEQAERDIANETAAQKKAYEKSLAAYEKEVNKRQETIEELKEQLKEMQADALVTEILAPQSGIITWIANYSSKDVLPEDAKLASISGEDTCYIIVENQGQKLNYGMPVEISYKDKEENTYSTEGKVVTLANLGLSPSLQSEYAVILATEPIENMALPTENGDRWNRKVFRVTATVQEMNNVLMVPKAAVTEQNGRLYVNVVQEDGSIVARSFLAGGSSLDKYWILDGLEEGMTICYE